LDWNPAEGKYFTPTTQKMFVGLLMALNVIMFYWFMMIVKVISRLFTGSGTDDPRSDDEDEDDSDELKRKPKAR
jgi:acyl-CoA-dependent ceramide synthase